MENEVLEVRHELGSAVMVGGPLHGYRIVEMNTTRARLCNKGGEACVEVELARGEVQVKVLVGTVELLAGPAAEVISHAFSP